jgi:membrane protease YdiL (CAAX protease family)
VLLGTYFLAKDSLIDPGETKQIIDELGLSSPAKFLIFASSMSLVNSLIEEYVWRWFVFSKFKVLFGARPAIVLSAFFFTLHHVVIIESLGSLWLVFLGSLGLFVGGIIWGWLYNKYNSVWPGWICHVAADTAIMWIAWRFLMS